MSPFRTDARLLMLACGLTAAGAAAAAEPSPSSRVLAAPSSIQTSLPLSHDRHHDGPPVVVVVAQGEAVLADFVVPYGVLAQSGAAKVIAVNVAEGDLRAGPLTLTPDMTAAEFDRAYPDGADYVIVPATADKHARELDWLRAQRKHGAALVSICDGVELLAEIGALDGRRATGHWASLTDRRKRFPKVAWQSDVRYVTDGDIASSAGVSAALPISLALVQSIAGSQVAQETAQRLGVQSWNASHDAGPFKLRPEDHQVHKANMHVKHDDVVAIEVSPGDDEVALSLHAEAWSRTMRNEVRVVTAEGGLLRLRGGLRVKSQAVSSVTPDVRIDVGGGAPAGAVLSQDLDQIAQRYGAGSARLSALGMEYPWGDLKAR